MPEHRLICPISKNSSPDAHDELKTHGILHVKSEQAPRYCLAKPASEITIGQVLRALDHPIASWECQNSSMSGPCNECLTPQACELRCSIAEVCDTITTLLDQTSLAEFLPLSADSASIDPYKSPADHHFAL